MTDDEKVLWEHAWDTMFYGSSAIVVTVDGLRKATPQEQEAVSGPVEDSAAVTRREQEALGLVLEDPAVFAAAMKRMKKDTG